MSTARIDFTRGAAERIASVVRRVEQGERDGAPLTFGQASDPDGTKLKIVNFDGLWGKGVTKTVFIEPTTSTISVMNLFANISLATCPRKGAAAKIGNTWYLVAAEEY